MCQSQTVDRPPNKRVNLSVRPVTALANGASAAPDRPATGPVVPGASLDEIERHTILRTLEAVGGSTARAAAILKISPRTIQYKVKQYRSGSVTTGGRRAEPEAGEEPEPPPW